MAKKYRVLVSNTVLVALLLNVKDDTGKEVPKRATLVCERIEATDLAKAMADGEKPAADFLRTVVKGWQEQNIVQDDEAGQLAAFSAEAFDAMLELPGVAVAALRGYVREVQAKEKN